MIRVRSCNDCAIILQVYAHHRPACVYNMVHTCGVDFSNMNMKRKPRRRLPRFISPQAQTGTGIRIRIRRVDKRDDSLRRHGSAASFSVHRQPSVDNASLPTLCTYSVGIYSKLKHRHRSSQLGFKFGVGDVTSAMESPKNLTNATPRLSSFFTSCQRG